MRYLLGKKIGMTKFINDAGQSSAVTVIEAGPCSLTQIKDKPVKSFQIGFGVVKKANKSHTGHTRNHPVRYLREFKYDTDNEGLYQPDKNIDLSIFDPKKMVDVIGHSKGKGFQGTVKRHHFKIGPKSHGSKHQRKPGSVGCRFPQHVIKGRKMPGRMGDERVTIKNLDILKIENDKNLILVKGCVPGNKNSLVIIRQK